MSVTYGSTGASSGGASGLIRRGSNEVKERLNKLLQRLRGNQLARAPSSSQRVAGRDTAPHHDRTGWTVYRATPPHFKALSVAEIGASRRSADAEVGAFKIRLAGYPESRVDAGFLVQNCYSRRGYRTSATKVNANVFTFAAYAEAHLAGTMSLRLDSTEGLAADQLFPAEIDELRRGGRRVCEFTRLAVDVSHGSRPVLAGLFHTVYLYAQTIHRFSYVVIEVNPRHVGYYRRALGFEVIGSERHNPRVNAPAVLMGMSFGDIARNLRRHAGEARGSTETRNIYAYGFSPSEQAGILGRLRTLGTN